MSSLWFVAPRGSNLYPQNAKIAKGQNRGALAFFATLV